MIRQVYDKWTVEGETQTPVRVQMFDYVAQFPTDAAADRYIDSVKKYRERQGIVSPSVAKRIKEQVR